MPPRPFKKINSWKLKSKVEVGARSLLEEGAAWTSNLFASAVKDEKGIRFLLIRPQFTPSLSSTPPGTRLRVAYRRITFTTNVIV